eukprot:jgi/Mesvir1/14927/Mv05518-RA.3
MPPKEKKPAASDSAAAEEKAKKLQEEMEEEISKMRVQLSTVQLTMAQLHVERSRLLEENTQLTKTMEETSRENTDLIAYMEREISLKRANLTSLAEQMAALQLTLEAKAKAIQDLELEKENEVKGKELAQALTMENHNLQNKLRDLISVVDTRESEITNANALIQSLESKVNSSNKQLDELRLQLARSTVTVFIGGKPWTVKRSKYRLKAGPRNGGIPMERERNSFTALGPPLSISCQIFLFGGTSKDGTALKDMYCLTVDSLCWEKMGGDEVTACARGSHNTAIIPKKRLLVFGGRRNPLLNDLHMMDIEHGKWTALAPKGAIPPPVEKAAATWVDLLFYVLVPDERSAGDDNTSDGGWDDDRRQSKDQASEPTAAASVALGALRSRDSAVNLGGATARSERRSTSVAVNSSNNNSSNGSGGGEEADKSSRRPSSLYKLDCDAWTWSKEPTSGHCPARWGASMTLSEDKRYIYMFGGVDDKGRHHNDVHVLRMDTLRWQKMDMIIGQPPLAREGHSASMVGKYLLVAGGYTDMKRLTDVHLFDTEARTWEMLDAASLPAMGLLRSRNLAVVGKKLISISCGDVGSTLDEMDLVELEPPNDDITDKSSMPKENLINVEVKPAPEPRSIIITWKVPVTTEFVEFKVMMSMEGVGKVRNVYSGKEKNCSVSALKPGHVYLLRVKGVLSDGVAMWSEVCPVRLATQGGTMLLNVSG